MTKSKPPLALIAGPTASGKSALAIALAERTNGVIVNADASQVYADVPILSAAPSEDDKKRAEHRLFGYLDGTEPNSAASWAERAKAEIADIQGSGRLPILVGGTGMYIRSLLKGMAPVPAVDPEIRAKVRAAPAADNLKQLETLDPDSAARLHAGDTNRIARALEVVLSSGKPLGHWQAQPDEGGIEDDVELRPIVLLPPREWIISQTDARFVNMAKTGAFAEVKKLLAKKLPPNSPVMQTIGVPQITAHLRGRTERKEAVVAALQATREYTRRQYTWLRNQLPSDWPVAIEPMTKPGAIERALTVLKAPA